MRPRISIRGLVHPSIHWSVGWSVTLLSKSMKKELLQMNDFHRWTRRNNGRGGTRRDEKEGGTRRKDDERAMGGVKKMKKF